MEAAQEALTEHAEEMRKVTAERDALRRHLLSQSQLSASNSASNVEDHGMIAASYETEHKFSRALSSKCQHRVTLCFSCYMSLRCCNLSCVCYGALMQHLCHCKHALFIDVHVGCFMYMCVSCRRIIRAKEVERPLKCQLQQFRVWVASPKMGVGHHHVFYRSL